MVILIIQMLSVDIDLLFDWSVNKKHFINILVLVLVIGALKLKFNNKEVPIIE